VGRLGLPVRGATSAVLASLLAALLIVPATAIRAQDPEPTPPTAPRITPPELIEAPPVSLPEGAEPLPDEAAIELLVTIAADGTVQEARILTPLREDVDTLVLEAAQRMRFAPATRDGVPIPSRIRFRYRITPPAPPPSEEVGEQEETTDETTEEQATEEAPEIAEVETEADLRPLGIEARVERVEPGAVERITLQAEELTTVPGTFGEPLRVVATLPGVVRSPFGLGFFLVRGANFQNTGFYVDGFQVPLLYHLGAGPAVISSRLVDRIDFYPGGYPSMYGRFTAGIVSVETAPPPTDRVRGELEVDLFRASALTVVPFAEGRGSIAAAFRRSYFELLLPLVAPGLTLSYTDYQVRADYRVDSRMHLSLFFFGSDDVLDQTGSLGSGMASEGTQTALNYNFQRLIARMNLRLPNNARLSLSGMLGLDSNSFASAQPGSDPLRIGIQNGYAAFRGDVQLPWPGIPELQTNFGVDITATTFDVNATAFVPPGLGEYPRPLFTPQASEVERIIVRALAAAYVEQVLRLGPVQVSASGRFEYMRYGDVSDLYPDPRLVVRWQVVPELLLKGATGLFSQPPIPFQLARDGGNPGLRPERAWQNSVGAELTLPERVEVHTTFFYNQFYDLVRQVNRVVDSPEGPRRVFFANEGEGRAYGLELLVRRRVEQGFYGWLSYTLSRSERLNGNVWEPFVFDQTHVLNLAASYSFDGWRFGVAFQVATGRPNRTVVDTIYDADVDEIDPTFRDRGDRVQAFHRLDIRIDRDFDLGFMTGSVFLDIQNVYNAPNAEGVLYSYDYSQSAPLPGLPILPTIGIRGVLR
jgi:TonB family protein